MASAPFATSDDVAEAWRALTSDEDGTATFWLRVASSIIRTEVPTVDGRVAAGTLDPDLVMGVTVAMVLRRLQNPDGWRSEQEAIEDYSTSKTRDSALSAGGVYLTDEEKCLLEGRSGAFSITPSTGPVTCETFEQIAINRRRREGWYGSEGRYRR